VVLCLCLKAKETYVPRPGSRAAGSSAARTPAPAATKKAAAAPKGSSPGGSAGPAAASGASRQKGATGSRGKPYPADASTGAAAAAGGAEGEGAGVDAAVAGGLVPEMSSAAPSSAAAAAGADGLSGGGVHISQVTREVADLYRGIGAKQAPSAGRSRRPSQRAAQARSGQRKRKRDGGSKRGVGDDGGFSTEQEDVGDLDYAAEGDASAGEDEFETLTDGPGSGRTGKGGKSRRPAAKGSASSRGAAGGGYRSCSRQRQRSGTGADDALGFREDQVMGSRLGPMPSGSGGLDALAAAAAASEEAHQQEDVHRRLCAGNPIAAANAAAAAAAAAEHHSQQGICGHGYGHACDPPSHTPHSYSGLGLVGFERGGASYSSGRQRSRSPAGDAAAAIAAAAAAQATKAAAEEAEAAALDAAGVLVGDGSGLSQQGLGSTVLNPNPQPNTHSMEVDTPVWRDALQQQQQQHLFDRRSSETSAYQAGSAVAGTSPAAAAATAAAFPASPTGHWEGFQGSRFNTLLSSPAGGLALGFWPKGSRDDVALGQLTGHAQGFGGPGPAHQGFAARPPHHSAFSHPQQQPGRGTVGAGGRGRRGPRGSADGGGGWGRRGSSDGGLAAAAFDALAAHQGRLGNIRGFPGAEGAFVPGAGGGTRSEGGYVPPGRAPLLTTGAGIRTPEVILPAWGVRVKRSGRHQVKMTDADVVMRPAQSAQQQDVSTAAAGTGPVDGTQGDTTPGTGTPPEAAAAGDAGVVFGSSAGATGRVEPVEGPVVCPTGEGIGVGMYSPQHHQDPGDLSDSCSQVSVAGVCSYVV
jgi:hypothetical protein